MRLLRVELATRVHVRGHGETSSINAEMAALSYDEKTDMVVIGNDGDEVPRSQVISWRRDRSRTPPLIKIKCEKCARQFNDNRALGAHMYQAHGVNGTTRKR